MGGEGGGTDEVAATASGEVGAGVSWFIVHGRRMLDHRGRFIEQDCPQV